MKRHLILCLAILSLLEIWRPHYFLTDDNLSAGFPILVEIGRHLKEAKSPFISDHIFGGHYDLLRDIGFLCWHPFCILPSLLADTRAEFWMMDITAFLFILLATVGFTLLACELRREFNPTLPDLYLTFYTFSFLFSTYILTVGPSWGNFLGNQSALPWLVLGILDRKMMRGTGLVILFTIHSIFGGYQALSLSSGICLTLFALGISIYRLSPAPLFAWCAGNILALLLSTPFLFPAIWGFIHSSRAGGFSQDDCSLFSIPISIFPLSLFLGNWTAILANLTGSLKEALSFPYLPTLLACGAAWCVLPALVGSRRWRFPEALCLAIALLLMVLIIRPNAIALAMHHTPFLRSLRWPFRESLQFLFFIHLFLLIRVQEQFIRLRSVISLLSLAAFILPLPLGRAPSFNALSMDRQEVLSGKAEIFWNQVKLRLNPHDQIATVIDSDPWAKNIEKIPYSLLGTANFPALYQVTSVSGYSMTSPADQMPIKTIPFFWFGAYSEKQVAAILQEKPELKIIELVSATPLKIMLIAGGKKTDLTPYLTP